MSKQAKLIKVSKKAIVEGGFQNRLPKLKRLVKRCFTEHSSKLNAFLNNEFVSEKDFFVKTEGIGFSS